MNRSLVLGIALAAVGCKAKDKDKDKAKDEGEQEAPETKPAPDAGKAGPTAALDAAAAAAPSDGGTAVAAVADAGPPAADAMPVKKAEPGAFYLVNTGPLDTMLVIEELYKQPAAEGGEFSFGYEDEDNRQLFQVAQRFTTPPDSAGVVGQRVALWGIDGVKCTATIKEVVAVGQGGLYGGPLKDRGKEPKDTPDLVAALVAEVYDWSAAASLADIDGKCDDAVFAIAADAKPKLLKVKAAKDWEDAAEAAYDQTSRVMDAHAKKDLEGGPGVKMVSVRKLAAASGPSLALVYASLNDHRWIGVFSVPGPTFEGAKYLGTFEAPAPSEVVGGDFDGDGLIDAVISHDSGAAVVFGSGEGQTVFGYQVDTPVQ